MPTRPLRPLPSPAVTVAFAALLAMCAASVAIWSPVQALADLSLTSIPDHAALLDFAVSLVPIVGAVALMLAVRYLLVVVVAPQPARATALVLMLALALPSAIADTVAIGRFDMLSAAAAVMTLAAAHRRRHVTMLVWYGLAVAIQAAALCAAPVIAALLIGRRVPLRLWPVLPLVALATLLPTAAAGGSIGDLLTGWLRPIVQSPDIPMHRANIWVSVRYLLGSAAPNVAGLAMVSAVGTGAAFVAWGSTQSWKGREVIAAMLLCTLVTAGLLPPMHDASALLADVLALVLALARRDREGWATAALVQTGWWANLADTPTLALIGTVAMLWATIRVARPLLKRASNDNACPTELWVRVVAPRLAPDPVFR